MDENEGRFMTGEELSAVAEVVNFLNENVAKHEIRFESTLYDSNGDVLGTIDFSESGYVFYLSAE